MRRALLTTAVLLGLTQAALSCPPLDSCLVQLRSTTSVTQPHVASYRDTQGPSLDLVHALDQSASRADQTEVEIPWFWRAMRDKINARTPAYQQDDTFKLKPAVVVVSGPSATVSGLGVAGTF